MLAQTTLDALDAKGKEYRERVKTEAKSDKQKKTANWRLDKAYNKRKSELQNPGSPLSSPPKIREHGRTDLPTQEEFEAEPETDGDWFDAIHEAPQH